MGRLGSLWVKLAVGFLLVAVVAVGLVAVLANRATTRQFELYVSQGKQRRAEQLAPQFAAYYQRTGSWSGVGAWMASLPAEQGEGQRRGQGSAGAAAGTDRILLAGVDGRLIADSLGGLVGAQLSDSELALGVPVEVGGDRVAVLLVTPGGTVHEGLEAEFLAQVNRSFWLAGLLAAGLALFLGLLLARQLTAPLRALTEATGRLAAAPIAPEDAPQVRVVSDDEIGRLGRTFNEMARSLGRQETLRRNLLSDVAHELRTPLSVIRSDLEAIQDGVYEPTTEVLASLHEETLLLSRLVDDLRALAQAEAGQLRLERQPTDLGELLRGMLPGFECSTGSGPALCLDLAPDLPLVDVDGQRVRQVVGNLVSNALRHAAESTRVVVSAVPHVQSVKVSVADDGRGIPPEDLPHVFDRFWRGGRAGQRSEGSGLGLAIARELVLAHGGEIWAETITGGGIAFHFTLPRA